MSYKPEVVADSSGKFCGNGLTFATQAEASAYACDLAGRWMLVTDWRAVESNEPVNYSFIDGKLVAVEQAT